MSEGRGRIHYENPFVTPVELREPARRLRGRMAAPVTIWTSGAGGARTGLTISSAVIAEGRPSLVLGLMNDTSDLFEAIQENGRFVVHVLEESHKVLADVFAGLRPSPGGMFSSLDTHESEWGPVLSDVPNRAFCRHTGSIEAGYQRLVQGAAERIELDDLERPLVYFRGRYRPLRAL